MINVLAILSTKRYHMEHHVFQGEWEGRTFRGPIMKALWLFLTPVFCAGRSMGKNHKSPRIAYQTNAKREESGSEQKSNIITMTGLASPVSCSSCLLRSPTRGFRVVEIDGVRDDRENSCCVGLIILPWLKE